MCNCYTVTKKSTKNWTLCVGSHFLKLEWSWKIRWKCFQITLFIKNQQLLKKLKIQYLYIFIITYSSCSLAEKGHENMFFKTVVCLLSSLHLCIVRDFILWNSSEHVLLSWMLFLKKGAPWQLFSMYRCLLLILHICNQLLRDVIAPTMFCCPCMLLLTREPHPCYHKTTFDDYFLLFVISIISMCCVSYQVCICYNC